MESFGSLVRDQFTTHLCPWRGVSRPDVFCNQRDQADQPRSFSPLSQPRDFVAEFETIASRHRVLNHPWLDLVASEDVDTLSLLRDYAACYRGYSAWFTKYLTAVIERLEDPAHRRMLSENLREESGQLNAEKRGELQSAGIDPTWVDGVPHSQLFDQFCEAIGLERSARGVPSITERWRARFYGFLEGASGACAVGALGLGTEGIVDVIYQPIVQAVRRVPGLSRKQAIFFELHCLVDDHHAEDLSSIARQLGRDQHERRELYRGMLYALELRAEFCDELYELSLHKNAAREACSEGDVSSAWE